MTGSIAAIKAPEIARELIRRGADVWAAMTKSACEIIHPFAMEWATGNAVVHEVTGRIEYLELAEDADLILVAPATANTIGKMVCGLADDCVSLTVCPALGLKIPIVVAPAMHESMFRSPVLTKNLDALRFMGVGIVGPQVVEGKAKVADVDEIVEAVIDTLSTRSDLKGRSLLITAGPTREYIDAVRFISNRSSGKMGVAMVEEALARGAEVTLIYGPGTATPPSSAKIISVETSDQMRKALESELKERKYDAVVLSAAVSDYSPQERIDSKLSSKKAVSILLKPIPKIAKIVRKLNPKCLIVGFKAEYNVTREFLVELAHKRLREHDMDLIVANDVGREGSGFSVDTNEVFIVDRSKSVIHVPLSSKRDVAIKIIDAIAQRMSSVR